MMRMEIPCFVHGNMENGSSHWGVIFECLDSTPSIGSEFNGLWVASPSYWKNQHHSHDRTWVCLCHWLGPTMTQYFAGNSHNSIYISYTYIVTWCHIAKPSPANNKLLRNGSYGSYKILRNDPSEVLAGPEELQMRPARSWRISFRRNRRKWCFHSLRCHRDAKRCTATRLDTLLM
jgi:hypothetical protein